MKLLGRRDDADKPGGAESASGGAGSASGGAESAPPPDFADGPARAGTTAPKGRPTPKRDDKRRGPVAPAPMTTAEARKRRKEMRRTMTRQQRRAAKQENRAALAHRRERMMAGEEAFLLPRDRGPVRRYVRDLVDSRRHVLGLFMPSAIVLIVVMLGLPPQLQYVISLLMLVFISAMAVDAVLLGRKVNRAVAAKFPDSTETGFKLGYYAAGRASQLRRMRIPRPMVPAGATVD